MNFILIIAMIAPVLYNIWTNLIYYLNAKHKSLVSFQIANEIKGHRCLRLASNRRTSKRVLMPLWLTSSISLWFHRIKCNCFGFTDLSITLDRRKILLASIEIAFVRMAAKKTFIRRKEMVLTFILKLQKSKSINRWTLDFS